MQQYHCQGACRPHAGSIDASQRSCLVGQVYCQDQKAAGCAQVTCCPKKVVQNGQEPCIVAPACGRKQKHPAFSRHGTDGICDMTCTALTESVTVGYGTDCQAVARSRMQ